MPLPPPPKTTGQAPRSKQTQTQTKMSFAKKRARYGSTQKPIGHRPGRRNLIVLQHPRLRIEYRMNKLEKKYAEYLEELKDHDEIIEWRFESIKWRMADKTWYTPDFFVICSDLTAQVHEVKGRWEQHSRVKIKAVAELYPEFEFIAVQWKRPEKGAKMQWMTETFAPKQAD